MKIKKVIKNCSLAILSAIMVGTMTFNTSFQEVNAAESTQYFWLSLYDPDNGMITSQIITDDTKSPDENTYSNLDTSLMAFTLTSNPSTAEDIINDDYERKSTNGDSYPYTFPGTITNGDNKPGTAQDKSMATSVANGLTNSFNSAMNMIQSECNLPKLTQKQYFSLATSLVNSAYAVAVEGASSQVGSYSFDDVSCEWTVTPETDESKVVDTEYSKGSTLDDYIQITVNGNTSTFLFSHPKGYSSGQYLAETMEDVLTEDSSWMNDRLSWSHVVYQAEYNAKKNVMVGTYDDGSDAGWFESILADLAHNILNSVQNILGLQSIDEMMLNKGTRELSYYKGIMNYSWFTGVSIIYACCLVVALVVIGYGIVKLMTQANLSVINASQRVSLMEGVKDLALTGLFLLGFYPFFLILCQFNYLIVRVLASLVENYPGFQDSIATGGFGLGAVIIAIVVFFISLKININYLIRSITIAALFATSPYFISTFSIPGKKDQFFAWLRELLANIFMQTFDALMCVIFIVIINAGSVSFVEKLAMAIAFIPLNSFFKNAVFNMGTKSEDVGRTASSILGSAVGNAAAGIGLSIGRRMDQRKNGGSNTQTDSSNTSYAETTSATATETKGSASVAAMQDNGTGTSAGITGQNRQSKVAQTISNIKDNYNNLSLGKKAAVHGALSGAKALKDAGSLAVMTGIQMGTSAIGGHSFAAEIGQTRAAGKLEDSIIDDGVVGTTKILKDGFGTNVNELGGYSLNDLASAGIGSGIDDGNTIDNSTPAITSVPETIAEGRNGEIMLNGLEFNTSAQNYTVGETKNIAKQMIKSGLGNDSAFKVSYDEKIITKTKDGKETTKIERMYKNLTPEQYINKSSSSNTRNFKTEGIIVGGSYENAKVNVRDVKDSSSKIVPDKRRIEVTNQYNQQMSVPDFNKMAGRPPINPNQN